MSDGGPPPADRMEFQRMNLWVGAFVLGALLLVASAAALSLHRRWLREEYRLTCSFPRIEGLRAGAEVLLRGYPVGRVTAIRLATDPEIEFEVEVAVLNEVRLPAGSRARLSIRGFGSRVLEIVTPGDPAFPDAPAPPAGGARAFLADGDRLMSDRASDLDTLLFDVVGLTRRAAATLERFDRLLDDRVGPAVDATTAFMNQDLAAAVGDLQATSAAARRLVVEAEAMVAEARPRTTRVLEAAEEDLRTAGDLLRESDEFLDWLTDRFEPLMAQMSRAAAAAEEVLGRADRAASEEELAAIIDNMLSLTEDGAALMEELRKRPWRLVRRVKGEKKALIEEMEEQRRREAGSPGAAEPQEP